MNLLRTIALLSLGLFFLTGCESTSSSSSKEATMPEVANDGLGNEVATISVPDGLSSSDVKESILAAAIGREWNIKDSGSSKIVLYLKHRRYESTLTLKYDDDEIKMYSNSYIINSDGVRKEPGEPKSWIKNLKRDINKNMSQKAYLDN